MISLQIKQFERMRNTRPQQRKNSKTMLRPHSSSLASTVPQKTPLRINSILNSLERNIKDLKGYYSKEANNIYGLSKSTSRFRLKKMRNKSQAQISKEGNRISQQQLLHSDLKDRNSSDIFQIKACFYKTYGRDSNSIIELYDYFKKNQEKREKSTRILASIDVSNPTMALSIEGAREIFLRPEQRHSLKNKENPSILKENNQNQLKQSSQNTLIVNNPNHSEVSDPNPMKVSDSNTKKLQREDISQQLPKPMKTSSLASQLMSKGLYNISNVANLMLSKKYKLTKEKQQSFMKRKRTSKTLRIDHPQENNINIANYQPATHPQQGDSRKISARKMSSESSNKLNCNVSFEASPIPSQRLKESFEMSSIKKISTFQPQIENSGLEESPIASKKSPTVTLKSPSVTKESKTFLNSKYYVQPLPPKKQSNQISISLKSNSKIIDDGHLPFDF